MSSYQDPTAQRAETEQQKAKGLEAFLSGEEREQLQRFLGFPEDFPRRFGEWMLDYIATSGLEIPISQIRGFTRFTPSSEIVLGGEATTSSTYDDLTTVGPTLSELGKGTYLVRYGCDIAVDPGNGGLMSISLNGEAPDTAQADVSLAVGASAGDGVAVSSMIEVVCVLELESNTIQAKYKQSGGTTALFAQRWISAARI